MNNIEENLKMLASDPIIDFILKYGRHFTADELTYAGKRGRRHDCYENAGKAALTNGNLLFVEGFIVDPAPIQHGWNVTRDGRLIDFTLRRKPTQEKPQYFGVIFSTEYLRRRVLDSQKMGVIHISR